MKKLLTILLSMALVLSLAAPAFAVPAPDAAPVDGVYTVDGEAVPVYKAGDAIPISAFLPEASNDAVLSIIGGADGPTSIITTGPLGGFNWDGLDLEGLDPGSTDWAELEKQFEQMYQQQRDEIKKALGGVPGQVGVMVNGVYVKFPDAAPEVAGGRTMVPVRALVEAMGGEVDYEFADQKDSVRLFIDKYTINFTIGGTTAVRHTRGTDTGEADKTIEMDCAPYIKGGSAYVPVRFIAEALGCDVGLLLVPMHLTGGLARCCSPFLGAMIAVSGMAEIDAPTLCKRNAAPMTFAIIVCFIASAFVFGL